MYPRGGHGHWFSQTYMPNRNFQRGGWDMPQNNCFLDMPGPGWGQFDPRKQRTYDDNLDNYRGSYRGRGRRRSLGYFHEKHHHCGRSYRGSKSSFPEGSYHHTSRSLCLITPKKENDSGKKEADSTTSKETEQSKGDSASSVKKTDSPKPSKKENDSEKMEAHSSTSKETEQGKGNSASSVKKTDSFKKVMGESCTVWSQVSQMTTKEILSPIGFSFRLTESSTYPQNKEKVLPEKKEESKLAQIENSQAAEVSHSHTSPILSAKTPTEEQTSSNITKGPHSMEKEPTVLPETKQDVILSMTGVSSALELITLLKCKETICSLGNSKTEMVKDESSEVVEDSANQTHPVPSPGAPVEEQTVSETTEDNYPIAKENCPLLEVRQSTDHFEHASAYMDVKIPFLCETTNDHPSEEKEAIELTSSTGSCEDVSHEQKDAVVTADVCSPPHTLSGIRCVPVLVRQTKTKLPFPWEIDSLLDEPLRGWAPEDCQEPPLSVNEVDKSEKVSECGRDSEHVFCDKKCHIEILCSTKSHHSNASKYSNQNCAPRELFIQRSRSPHSQEQKSRSPHSQDLKSRSPHSQEQKSRSPRSQEQKSRSPHSREQKSRSPCISEQKSRSPCSREQKSRSPRSREQKSRSPHSQEHKSRSPHSREQKLRSPHSQEHKSRSPHSQEQKLRSPHSRDKKSRSPHRRKKSSGSPQQQEQELRSAHRQEESSSSPHKQEQCLRSPHRKKQRLKSSHRQEQSSRLYHKRKWPFHGQERSSVFLQRRRIDFGRRYYPYCDCKHSCSLPQDNFWEEDLLPHYLPFKIKCSCSPKERSKTCKVLRPCSPASNAMRTKKKKVKKVMLPEETAKMRTSLEEGKEPVKMQMTAKSEETGSPHLPNIEEKDHSAAVLARTEEIEKAYLRVLLNFAGVAVMLVEKEPSLEATIDSALRANLRRIGDYYEHMLKNYIDSLAEEET